MIFRSAPATFIAIYLSCTMIEERAGCERPETPQPIELAAVESSKDDVNSTRSAQAAASGLKAPRQLAITANRSAVHTHPRTGQEDNAGRLAALIGEWFIVDSFFGRPGNAHVNGKPRYLICRKPSPLITTDKEFFSLGRGRACSSCAIPIFST